MKGKNVVLWIKPVVTEAAVTLMVLLFLAFFMLKQGWGKEFSEKAVIAVYALASLSGGFQAGLGAARRKYLRGLEYGGIYFLLFCLLLLARGRGFQADEGRIWMILAVCMAGGMIGGMCSLLFDKS